MKREQDIIVGVATRHCLGGWGFEPRSGREIVSSPHQSKPALGPTQHPS